MAAMRTLTIFTMLLVGACLAPCVCAAAEPEVEVFAAVAREPRHEVLMSHGINPTPLAMIDFLENGFTVEARERGLPEMPLAKGEVVSAAIQELGFSQSVEAAPLLIRLMQGETTVGFRRIQEMDTESVPFDEAETARGNMQLALRFNSMITLGYLGDKSAAAPILEEIRKTTARGMQAEGAIALGLLDDPQGLPILMLLARDPEAQDLPSVFEAIYYLTGNNFGMSAQRPIVVRRRLVEELRAWFDKSGNSFTPDRAGILRRRSKGLPAEQLPVQDLRGALRATLQFDDYDVRYAARERLRTLGPGIAPDLRPICEDVEEDIDIRRAAMTWYSAADPGSAKKLMKRLSKDDENPDIRTQASTLVPEIEKALKSDK